LDLQRAVLGLLSPEVAVRRRELAHLQDEHEEQHRERRDEGDDDQHRVPPGLLLVADL